MLSLSDIDLFEDETAQVPAVMWAPSPSQTGSAIVTMTTDVENDYDDDAGVAGDDVNKGNVVLSVEEEEKKEEEDHEHHYYHHHHHHDMVDSDRWLTVGPSTSVLIVYGFESIVWLTCLCVGVYMDVQVEHIECTLEQKDFARFTICLMSYMFLVSSGVFATAALKRVCHRNVNEDKATAVDEGGQHVMIPPQKLHEPLYRVHVQEGGLTLSVQESLDKFMDTLEKRHGLDEFMSMHPVNEVTDTLPFSDMQPLLEMARGGGSLSPPLKECARRSSGESKRDELCKVLYMLDSVALLSFVIYVYMGARSASSHSYDKEQMCKYSFLSSLVDVAIVLAHILLHAIPRFLMTFSFPPTTLHQRPTDMPSA